MKRNPCMAKEKLICNSFLSPRMRILNVYYFMVFVTGHRYAFILSLFQVLD